MYRYQRILKFLIPPVILFTIMTGTFCLGEERSDFTDKFASILAGVTPTLSRELADKKLELGAPLFIRIFKLRGELEVWLAENGRYRLFKTYPICNYSGYLGPKLHEGDWQSPEGFYRVTADRMNPRSKYHLSFDIGYPNNYDTFLQRTGGDIMVHGGCSSMGCFAMSDHRMEEIYTLAHFAFLNGQESFDVHVFPFPITEENLRKFRFSPWIGFWSNLREGYTAFEQNHTVPIITAEQGKYVVGKPIKLALSPVKQ